MSQTKVILTVLAGKMIKNEYVLEEQDRYLMGRSRECDVAFPSDESHGEVSRYHCLIECAGPSASIRDLGSLNGTFVNGKKIGQRRTPQFVSAADFREHPVQELKDFDEVRIGNVVFRVNVVDASKVPQPPAAPVYFV